MTMSKKIFLLDYVATHSRKLHRSYGDICINRLGDMDDFVNIPGNTGGGQNWQKITPRMLLDMYIRVIKIPVWPTQRQNTRIYVTITPHCNGQLLLTRAAPFWERLAWLRILSTHLIKLKKWHKSLNLPSRLGSPVGWSQLKYWKGGKMTIFLCFVDIVYQKMFKIVQNRLRNEPYRPPHFGQNTENGRIFLNSVKSIWK